VIFILEPSEQAKTAIGKRVTVFDYPDGRLSIRYKGVELAYRTFDKIRQVDQGAIADKKRLGPVLAMIRDEQLRRGLRVAADRADAISVTPVPSRSAELLYEPGERGSFGSLYDGTRFPKKGQRPEAKRGVPRRCAIFQMA
jgi:hypothetical protein